jgi:hypothetical protein
MQPSLPAGPGDRNIKAVDIADSVDVAKIVETNSAADGRPSTPQANAFDPAIESHVRGMQGERSNVKSRSRLDEPGWIDIKGRMSATPRQTFDVYRKRTNPTLRLAVAPGAGLPGQFASKDWTLVAETSVLHSDVSEDVATKGYCYFQLVKG